MGKDKEILALRELLWLNHGHTALYGDDGEMQCAECFKEYGFYDYRRESVETIKRKLGVKING